MTLEVKHIAKSFGEKQVLKDVSFALDKGQIAVLMGANGSGKTTLFNIISGFLKQDNGEILLNKKPLNKTEVYQINKLGITRTFQDMRLIGNLTVKENIMLSFPNQKGENWWNVIFPNKTVIQEQHSNENQTNQILNTCFIAQVSESKANEISYGQQKLLNLSCCLANDAQVVLLDEPVAGVDPVYREKLGSAIQKLKQDGKAVLIIEHTSDVIEAVADKILFLNEGTIIQFDSYDTFKNNDFVQEAYI